MKNVLWYLGFLSALAALHFVSGNAGFLGFLGFLPYFATYNADDERFEANLGRASRNAFAYTIAIGAALTAYIALMKAHELFAMAFTVLFSGCLIVCVFSFIYYDKTGR
jgi:hypothetical protein